jgi:hypothetical protein
VPKSSQPQDTGRLGERWFLSRLPAAWVFQPPLEDVGIDGIVVICDAGESNGLEFRVQIKSSVQFNRKGDCIVIPSVKHSAMRYWLTGFTPTLLVAFEISSQTGWCGWANQVLAPVAQSVVATDGVRALELPMRVPIDENIWDIVSKQVGGLYAAIGRKLVMAGGLTPFLDALEELSGSLKHLYFAEAAQPPESERTVEQSDLMRELEATAHRDAVRAILALEKDLSDVGAPLVGLKEYAEEYTQRCTGFIRAFRELVETDGPVNCQVLTDGFASERRPLMNSIAGAIHELTQAASRASRAGTSVTRKRVG